MIKRFAVVSLAAAGICLAIPASAQVGVGVGPNGVGVTVGAAPDRVREREVIRERSYRDREETMVIKKNRGDRDYDRDRKTVIIERD